MDSRPAASVPAVDPALAAIVEDHIATAATVAAPTEAVAAALRHAAGDTTSEPLQRIARGTVDAVALLADELSHAGEHAEGLLAEAARVLRPGGTLAVTVRNRVYAAAAGEGLNGLRGFSAEELSRIVGQRGFLADLLCAPGAAALLGGHPRTTVAPVNVAADRQPGLLDAGPRLLAVARASVDARSRSTAFFASLPRKVVAAAVICRDARGRVLVVHDSFKGHWAIPGGVVDADENPAAGAAREAWEEAGLRVRVGPLLGVFSAAWPDRLVLIYGAEPADRHAAPAPVHAHEIDAVAWVGLADALARVAPHVAEQLRCCLEAPGGTWTLGRA